MIPFHCSLGDYIKGVSMAYLAGKGHYIETDVIIKNYSAMIIMYVHDNRLVCPKIDLLKKQNLLQMIFWSLDYCMETIDFSIAIQGIRLHPTRPQGDSEKE